MTYGDWFFQADTIAQPTKALYQYDEELRALTTSVVEVKPFASWPEADQALFKNPAMNDFLVQTAETIFYAQGGGQPFDTGSMERLDNGDVMFVVSAVRTASGRRILHLGHFAATENPAFEVGDTVKQLVDSARRDYNSRLHTAGHLVGLAVRQMREAVPHITELKAQHYPDAAFVEFQGLIDGKHKEAIQKQVDTFVEQKLPIKVYFWDESTLRERCAVVPEAVQVSSDGLTRAVDIEGAGAYPCGGTHVPNTSFLRKVQIRRISRQKGVSKVSYMIHE